tara:strand:- start:388 stop:1188 length:801 start_codon:yes stop_codon:yes gene_type:complete
MKENLLNSLIDQKSIRFLFKIFENNSKLIALVGGCVRDALLGKISRDIDIAINANPSEVIQILNKNKLDYDDFAYKYGSIATYVDGQKFQITSLREDLNQLGRHTNVIYTDDWKRDSLRRDFTINSMYLFSNGQLTDFHNGKEDLLKGKIKFIKKMEDSVQEDFLRIFRYYRFLGIFKNPEIITGYEEGLSKYCEQSLNYLSNDLMRQEILKMFKTSFPTNCFFNEKKLITKKFWVQLVEEHFIKNNYDIGINKCLNKINLLLINN